jgi:serine/threonine protein kinase
LQYGVLADIYSLSIILFELFSGIDPFPGSMGQIWQAKIQDEKPEVPSEFPSLLKEYILTGWSKKPRERPEIKKLRSTLSIMQKKERKENLTGNNETKITYFFFLFLLEMHFFISKVKLSF